MAFGVARQKPYFKAIFFYQLVLTKTSWVTGVLYFCVLRLVRGLVRVCCGFFFFWLFCCLLVCFFILAEAYL